MSFWCRLLGHSPTLVNTETSTAICVRCEKWLRVSYDMTYGQTVVVGELADRPKKTPP